MNLTCPECQSLYRVDPAKVPAAGVRARCAVCGGVITVGRPDSAEPHPDQVAPLAGRADPVSSTYNSVGAHFPREFAAVEDQVGSDPPLRDPGAFPLAPMAAEQASTEPAGSPAPAPPPPPPTPPSAATTIPATTSGRSAQPRLAPRRTNPYLSNDPGQRARRLARALVSDLVAYHPQKREEGLRNGTLKEMFRDEVRKSWAEYVDQVGASIAETTPYFQDALNDILAGGRRVF